MIYFRKIRYRNFLSFGNNFTEIQLDRSPTTLITGENGSGKSTMLDALTFVLYNKPFRKINKPQLVNSINGKNLVVEIEFDIGGKCYLIRRGIKPNVFEIYEHTSYEGIEEHLIPQDSSVNDYQLRLEKDILKMNYQAFTQIVILGKATFVPFMRLSAGDRRSVIEDLLGLRIFGTMNVLLKDKMKALKSNLSAVESNIEMCEDKIETRERYIRQLEQDRSKEIAECQARIEELESEISDIQTKSDKLSEHRQSLMDSISDETTVSNRKTKLIQMMAQLKSKIDDHQNTIEFFESNDVCSTCKQPIQEEHKQSIVSERVEKLQKIDEGKAKLKEEIDELNARIEEINEVNQKIQKIDRKLSEFNATVRQLNNQIRENNAKIKKLSQKVETDYTSEIQELSEELETLKERKIDLQETHAYYMTLLAMLKDDGIKTVIINKYLPIFNQLINQYLLKMGFVVKFTLDEQFNEQILSRYRDNFSYNNFSEGQKLRIDLAILLTWREVAKLKNSLNTNLLIMDEVFDSSLDQDGVDAFMDIIPSLGDSNIFVVSHTPDKLYDKFRSHIAFSTHQNFSVMETK